MTADDPVLNHPKNPKIETSLQMLLGQLGLCNQAVLGDSLGRQDEMTKGPRAPTVIGAKGPPWPTHHESTMNI